MRKNAFVIPTIESCRRARSQIGSPPPGEPETRNWRQGIHWGAAPRSERAGGKARKGCVLEAAGWEKIVSGKCLSGGHFSKSLPPSVLLSIFLLWVLILILPDFGEVPVRVEYTLEGFGESLGVKEQRPKVGPRGRTLPCNQGLRPQVGWRNVTLGPARICFKLPPGEGAQGRDTQGASTGSLTGYFWREWGMKIWHNAYLPNSWIVFVWVLIILFWILLCILELFQN